MIFLDEKGAQNFVQAAELDRIEPQVRLAQEDLEQGRAAGNEFLGWLRLPEQDLSAELAAIQAAAEKIRSDSEVLVVAGIGGSYLGSRAVLEALTAPLALEQRRPRLLFAGQNLSEAYLADLLDFLKDRDFSVNVISKSGTTTETALAFRLLKDLLRQKYGSAYAERIYATTDAERGALREEAKRAAYQTFVVPDDIGGRYSFLSAVGLLPCAVAGLDVKALLAGAAEQRRQVLAQPWEGSSCLRYAAWRTILMRRGYEVEILANFEPAMHMLGEWWKQLFGESEGKDGRGLFPATLDFTTDLHSMGQYIQEGRRFLFETFLDLKDPGAELVIPGDADNLDGLNYLAGRRVSAVNQKALAGTILAHVSGAVPCLRLEVAARREFEIGALLYFFEYACALSAYLNAVNPFNQPGVEAYKKNMFALLGKAGYEDLRTQLEGGLR